ncbi:MAG: LacI family transcriptional regulator [Actinomycetota bacterium]|nr:LacI family transcriptional regulator [Actinomycetota bacterium]
MSGRPTLERVAERAGVSRATVSRVVNGAETVDPVLREKVRRAVAELGYVPNRSARTLVTRRTDLIALVAAESEQRVFGDPFFTDIIRGVSQELAGADVQLVLMLAKSEQDYTRIERYLVPGHVDGALLISQHSGDALPGRLLDAGVPVVTGGRPPDGSRDVPHVDHDNVTGAELATRHLIATGRVRIGTITGPADMSAGVDRLTGFRRAAGDTVPADRIEPGEFTHASGVAATERLLERAPDVDGLFVASDLMALGCLTALRRAGRSVPDDVAVVGFDDIAAAAEAEPALTTVHQETFDQGRVMARMLLARIGRIPATDAGRFTEGASRVILPVRLVIRDSA